MTWFVIALLALLAARMLWSALFVVLDDAPPHSKDRDLVVTNVVSLEEWKARKSA